MVTGRRVIGVDLGGTKILAGIVDESGKVERQVERRTPTDSLPALVDALVETVGELRTPEIQAVGFGVPARIDPQTGVALGAVNIPLHDLRFRDEFEQRLGLPVGAVNDGGAAALAEARFGAGRGTADLVLLALGTGVGGGLILGGELYLGWAELGHMVIVEGGERCQGSCTGHGHVESYCSGLAADRLAQRTLGPGATSRDLIDQRHPALDKLGRHLGTAIASLVNIFNPEVVVIGGGFGVAAAELLFEPVRAVLLVETLAPGGADVRLAAAELGSSAGLIGAALVAIEALG